jgi:hypothetical protein
MPGHGQFIITVEIAIHIGELEGGFVDGGLECHGGYSVAGDSFWKQNNLSNRGAAGPLANPDRVFR